MRNNIRYKGNVNNTSVIVSLIDTLDDFCKLNKNFQRWYFVWDNLQEVFEMLVVAFINCCFCDVGFCCFYVFGLLFHANDTPPWFLRPVKASTSSELYYGYLWLLYFSVTFSQQALRFWVGIVYTQTFFSLLFIPTVLQQPAFIKASLGVGSSSLSFTGLHADPRNTDPAHLFVWFTAIHNLHIQKNSYLNRIKHDHILLVVKSLIYLLLTRFQLFSLVQSHM